MKCPKCKIDCPVEQFQSKRTSKICKSCSVCRSKADIRGKRHVQKDPAGFRQKQKNWLATEKGVKYKSRSNEARKTDACRETARLKQAKRRSTPEYAEYLQSDSYKASKKREYERMKAIPGAKALHYVQVALSDALRTKCDSSNRLLKFTEFSGFEDLKEHLEEQFEEGMTWQNHSHTGWNIGHRIAKAHYDLTCTEDIHRCWKRANLFPQWATGKGGNCSLKTRFPDSAMLYALKDCWPTDWNGVLPSNIELKKMEEKCNQKKH